MAINHVTLCVKTFSIQGTTNADYAARVHRFFEKYQKKPAQPLWPPGKEDLTQDDYDERYRLRGYKVRGNWKSSAKHVKVLGQQSQRNGIVWENSERGGISPNLTFPYQRKTEIFFGIL